jgi:Transposase DDE domain
MSFDTIPVFARFQWLNSPQVVHILSRFLQPNARGRKGCGKTLLFRWLMYKQLMRCSYRDLESMSGIDYTTFIKFRKRLIASFLLPRVFAALAAKLVAHGDDLRLIVDSSFVETYSGYHEAGSEYNGYKKANGFKLHSVIDYETRLPVMQIMTAGARSDVRIAHRLIDRAPPRWQVRSLTADKGYDSEAFVQQIKAKWNKARIGIPLRKTNQEKRAGHPEGWLNRWLKSLPRTWDKKLLRSRTEIERYFSRKKQVFHLGEEKTRGFQSFEANCYMTSIMEYLEHAARILLLFTRLYGPLLDSPQRYGSVQPAARQFTSDLTD